MDGNLTWTFGITNSKALSVDTEGFVYAAAAYDYEWASSRGDILTVKIRPDGTPVWSRQYNSKYGFVEAPTAMEIDRSGNVFVAGYVYRAASNSSQQNPVDILLIKYSPNGELLWDLIYNDKADQDDYPSDVCVDVEGSVYVAASAEQGWGREGLLLKYDKDGNHLWSSRYRRPGRDSLNDYVHIKVAEDGRIVVAGTSNFKAAWYHSQYLVAMFDQNTPRLAITARPVSPETPNACLVCPRGEVWDIVASTNLSTGSWDRIDVLTNLNGIVPFGDPAANEHSLRYYRARK